jgi:hypothetical protein
LVQVGDAAGYGRPASLAPLQARRRRERAHTAMAAQSSTMTAAVVAMAARVGVVVDEEVPSCAADWSGVKAGADERNPVLVLMFGLVGGEAGG